MVTVVYDYVGDAQLTPMLTYGTVAEIPTAGIRFMCSATSVLMIVFWAIVMVID
jgi:hypothetical protein